MNLQDTSYQSNFSNQPADKFKLLRRVGIGLIGLLLIIGIYQIHLSSQFRIVSTNPSSNSVATLSPFFNITFNKQLSDQGAVLSLSSGLLQSFTIKGNALDISLNEPLQAGQTYTITIKNVSSVGGQRITNKTISFIPKNIAAADLPADQRAGLQKEEPPANDELKTTTFTNISDLASHGLTTAQINDFVQAFKNFAPKAQNVEIANDSISPGPLDPAAATPIYTLNLDVSVDTTRYKATIIHSDLTTITLQLFDPQTNQQVFDSGVIVPGP